jgi:hypothetical protein
MPVTSQLPVISLISNEIFARLQTLISGSVGAYSFADVVRPTKIATYTPRNGLIVLTRGEIVRVNELDCVGNPPAIAWMQTFLIRVHIAPSENDATALELFEDIAESEIHRAICDYENWHTFDDNAINADFGPQQTTTADGSYNGIAVPLMVTYRVSEGDPYTVRA